MTRSYSTDPRARVAVFVEAGHSRRAAARPFEVSDSFAIKPCSAKGAPARPLRHVRAALVARAIWRPRASDRKWDS